MAPSTGRGEWLETCLDCTPEQAKKLLTATHKPYGHAATGRMVWKVFDKEDDYQLGAWNKALKCLKETPVKNDELQGQLQNYHCDCATRLRGLARQIAHAQNNPALFFKLEKACEKIKELPEKVPPSWETQWWELPFAQMRTLVIEQFREAGAHEAQLQLLQNARDAKDLRKKLHAAGIQPDAQAPDETFKKNRQEVEKMRSELWLVFCPCSEKREQPKPEESRITLGEEAYFCQWPEEKVLKYALQGMNLPDFEKKYANYTSFKEVMQKLGISDEDLRARKKEAQCKLKKEANKHREKCIIHLNDKEYDTSQFEEISKAVEESPLPTLTKLELQPTSSSTSFNNGGSKGRNGHGKYPREAPQEKRETIGYIGELKVFLYLKNKYNINNQEVISSKSWVSTTKTKSFKEENGNDSLGYDFEFAVDGKRHLLEVKST